jgi:hypothetical protein
MTAYPKKTKSDHLHAAFKTALSGVPLAGGPLSILFETILSSPIDKRKEEWITSLGTKLDELIEKNEQITPESLSENPIFISVALQASQQALRNHQEEKLTALRNAVLNTALDLDVDDNKALLFTNIIGEITPLHIKLLAFYDDVEKYENKLQQGSGQNTAVQSSMTYYPANINIWEESFPELTTSRELINLIVQELNRKGFIFHDTLASGKGSATNKFGKEFLTFISAPQDE